jgi:hypothetical protein
LSSALGAYNDHISDPDQLGNTPLIVACKLYGQRDTDENTVLRLTETIQLLLQRGAKWSETNKEGLVFGIISFSS